MTVCVCVCVRTGFIIRAMSVWIIASDAAQNPCLLFDTSRPEPWFVPIPGGLDLNFEGRLAFAFAPSPAPERNAKRGRAVLGASFMTNRTTPEPMLLSPRPSRPIWAKHLLG